MNTPRLSVCIPTFERSHLLGRSLQSVLAAFPSDDVEIVVLDNASQDDTGAVVERVCQASPRVRYVRNPENVGLDGNLARAIETAAGDYVFVFSDDDLLLPGSGEAILAAIDANVPSLLYLDHAGFWEGQAPAHLADLSKRPAAPDSVCARGFDFLYDWLLEHNSALVFRTSAVREALRRTETYPRMQRGYLGSALAYQVALGAPGPFVRVGRCCVAVRNTQELNYNPIYSSHIDVVRQYQLLLAHGLLSRAQLSRLMRKRVWGFRDNLILALRCSNHPHFSAVERNLIWRQDWRYWRFYPYLAPIVTLPRWIVCPAYRLGQRILRGYEWARGIERRVI